MSDHYPIESFRIVGLHGYKDVSINFKGRARVVIAENGAGKTTILSTLYGFLSTDFYRFRNLSFESIECQFTGQDKTLVLKKSDLPQPRESAHEVRLTDWSRMADVDVVDVRRAIMALDLNARVDVRSDPILEAIYYNSPMGDEEMVQHIRAIRNELDQGTSEELKLLASEIKGIMGKYEVLYLPTYRRVELPLVKRMSSRPRRAGPPGSRLDRVSKSRWSEFGIQFGLADVQDRLNQILADIQRESDMGYRVISANIIDELLADRMFADKLKQAALPDIESLSLFFSRIATPGSSRRLTAIEELYKTGEIESEANVPLKFFLAKLSRVVDKTKELESNIERFVEKVNDYLTTSSDEKKLEYDATRMKVVVKNVWTSDKVTFDDLSSGEKQVISILAHLYLYPNKKIVLIDEPELSLSLDWQKRLLPDVVDSPSCVQLLAITHSPFIFDNSLDPFAGPLMIARRKRVDL